MKEEIHEKCGVVGVSLFNANKDAALYVREVLAALQHRGRDGTGIASGGKDKILCEYKNRGSVEGVLAEDKIARLAGSVAIGHNRYATNGDPTKHMQPFTDPLHRFAFAHNGNLPDTTNLERALSGSGVNLDNYNDSEIAGIAIVDSMQQNRSSLPDAIENIYNLMQGAFSCVAAHDDILVAFRDHCGIRPLEIGKFASGLVISSETCGLDSLEAEYIRSVAPGEMVVIKDGKIVEARQLAKSNPHFDIFEYIYFGRPDSVFNGESVSGVRFRLGKELAMLYSNCVKNKENTVVIPIPETSYLMADGFAKYQDIHISHAIYKNQLISRSFMMKTQSERNKAVRSKHNVIQAAVNGKDVILIDDSIVRLTTIPIVVDKVRKAGAKSVSVLIGSSPIRYPDFYGINTPDQDKLAAAVLTIDQIKEQIGCDFLGYLPISAMVRATGLKASQLNLSSFNGEYPIDIGAHRNDIVKPKDKSYLN
ncbi:MAG: amidophosphoribosyltransferase [Patescibacteria group bacterium]|nr:amidophosphoribosyltransferase [Patescibacteria group bacterium]